MEATIPKVLIVIGSDSDYATVVLTQETLTQFGIASTIRITSAHRTPERTAKLLTQAEANGYRLVIAAAGLAAHLAGVCAAHTLLPVIAIPLNRSPLGGRDALYASVMMPSGVPVATVAIGEPGAKNAALFAVRILALSSTHLRHQLEKYREKLVQTVIEKDDALLRRQSS